MTLEGQGSSGCSPVLQGRFTIPVNCVKSLCVCVCKIWLLASACLCTSPACVLDDR